MPKPLNWRETLNLERMTGLVPIIQCASSKLPQNCTRMTALAEFDDGELIHLNIERKPEVVNEPA